MLTNYNEDPTDYEVECPLCGGFNPKELAAGSLSPSSCRCGYFRSD